MSKCSFNATVVANMLNKAAIDQVTDHLDMAWQSMPGLSDYERQTFSDVARGLDQIFLMQSHKLIEGEFSHE